MGKKINLVGKFSNSWGCERLIQKGFEQLDYKVNPIEISQISPSLFEQDCLTIVLQGYGLTKFQINQGKILTRAPWVLWHAEVLSSDWPSSDPVVQFKAEQLKQNISAFDAVGHNCYTALNTVRKLGGKKVFHALNNGVDPDIHKSLNIPKLYDLGFYGHPSSRRESIIRQIESNGFNVMWVLPQPLTFGIGLIKFINQCYVILNIHYSETKNLECRLYESLGCGVPVISECVSMPDVLPHGITYLDNISELTQEIISQSKLTNSEFIQSWMYSNVTYKLRCIEFLSGLNGVLG